LAFIVNYFLRNKALSGGLLFKERRGMGKYFIGNETKRISFEDGEWVDIKEELTQEDSDYILNQLAKASAVGDSKKPSASVEVNLGKLALLERAVVDWSFADEKGIKAPVTRDNLSKLRRKYRTRVLQEVNKLNEEAEAFAKN